MAASQQIVEELGGREGGEGGGRRLVTLHLDLQRLSCLIRFYLSEFNTNIH